MSLRINSDCVLSVNETDATRPSRSLIDHGDFAMCLVVLLISFYYSLKIPKKNLRSLPGFFLGGMLPKEHAVTLMMNDANLNAKHYQADGHLAGGRLLMLMSFLM